MRENAAPLSLRPFNPRVVPVCIVCAVGIVLNVTPSIGEPRDPALTSSGSRASAAAQNNVRWLARYDGPAHDFDLANAIALSPDNKRVYITGYSPGNGTSNDYATIAYDAASGAQLWVARYNGPGNGFDQGKCIAVSPDGTRVFVTGDSDGVDTGPDFATIAYDAATGAELWVARYNGIGNGTEEASGIAVSPDGLRVYITGSSDVSGTDRDFATVAYSAATGAQLWVAGYDGGVHGFDFATSLALSPDGSTVYVTGGSDGGIGPVSTGQDFATIAYNSATGAQLWVTRYNPYLNGSDTADAIKVSPDGMRVFVAGQSQGLNTNKSDIAVIAYNAADGLQQWAARYNSSVPQSEQVSALGITHDGSRVFVTGATLSPTTDNDYVTVAFDAATGNQQWVATYDGPGHGFDAPSAMVVSSDNSVVYVTGSSDGGAVSSSAPAPDSSASNLDYATIAYDAATGAQKWIARYDDAAHANDIATSMVLSADDGSLYVTGGSTGSSIDLDYVTIAYATRPPWPVQLVGVASRKTHGSAGTFDVDLLLTGPGAIECRSGGTNGNYAIVFTFANTLTGVSGATLTSGTGSVAGNNIDSGDAHNYIVNLAGVANAQYITVSLANVTDSAGNFSNAVAASMSVLIGDVNATGLVDGNDVSAVQGQARQTANSTNFRLDVNATGLIDGNDVSLVQSKTRTSLPSPP